MRWMVLIGGLLFFAGAFADETHLLIVHINDSHGQLTTEQNEGYPVARIAHVVNTLRERHPGKVLFLHAGDEISRGDALTRATLGASSFALFDAMGLDVFTAGNGDFYDGASNLLQIAKSVRFPVLHSNTKPEDKTIEWFPETAILERGGVKIGIVGGGRIVRYEPFPKVKLAFFNDTVKPILSTLTNNVDLTIALTHHGVANDFVLAREDTGIDLIIGGDSHTAIPMPIPFPHARNGVTNCTWIAQAGEYGKYIGYLDVALERPNEAARYRVKSVTGHLIRLHHNMPDDEHINALVEAWQRKSLPVPAHAK